MVALHFLAAATCYMRNKDFHIASRYVACENKHLPAIGAIPYKGIQGHQTDMQSLQHKWLISADEVVRKKKTTYGFKSNVYLHVLLHIALTNWQKAVQAKG